MSIFDPLKFKEFGKLAKLDLRKWPKKKRRFHKDTYIGARWNRGDSILWHGYNKRDKVCWNTAIGRGRPAWNIQDAAMIAESLGFTIDIACGGVDNIARHNDYTIAIMESLSRRQLARYWFHVAHLLIDRKKMSKSKGNIIYPDDLLKRGYDGSHIRFFLIYSHYRKRLSFNYDRFSKQ